MFSQLAQVFSSQGVLIQGTKYASMPPTKRVKATESEKNGEAFKGLFDQASAKLEISKSGNALSSRVKDVNAQETANLAATAVTVDGGPEETLLKAQLDQRAALAPAETSSQERAVAGAAAQIAMDARLESESGEVDQGNSQVARAYSRNPTVTGKSFAAYA